MKRIGYTIAETLITITIIGIVATLTIPTFTSKYRKQVYPAILSSTIADFENAMTSIIMKEGVNDLLDTRIWKTVKTAGNYVLTSKTQADTIEDFMNLLSKIMPIEKYETAEAYYKPLSNPNGDAETLGEPVRFCAKNGVDDRIEISDVNKDNAKSEVTSLNEGTNYLNRVADVFIDVNGYANSPNIQGRDFFRFELGSDGHLYPYGGKDWAIYNDETYTSPKEKCVTNKEGYYCAAYLMENSYKMDY